MMRFEFVRLKADALFVINGGYALFFLRVLVGFLVLNK